MARRWLLGLLTSVTMVVGAVSPAAALPADGDPIEAEAGDAASATVTPAPEDEQVTAEAEASVEAPEAETIVSPVIIVQASPDGPEAAVSGPVEAGGVPVPLGAVTDPVDGAAGPVGGPGDQTASGDGGVRPASEPPADDPAPSRSGWFSADGAAVRAGISAPASVFDAIAGELAPLVAPTRFGSGQAPPTTTTTQFALPAMDPAETVPSLLRLLAGLLVVGAAATWGTVKHKIA